MIAPERTDRYVDTEVVPLAERVYEQLKAIENGELVRKITASQVQALLRIARQRPDQVDRLAQHQLKRARKLADENRPSPNLVFWKAVDEVMSKSGGAQAKPLALRELAASILEREGALGESKKAASEAVKELTEELVSPFFEHFAYLLLVERMRG
jgi:division protein CdvB (Snf7/Vps24/ESCRT-III family)